jgi:hypothetical protein
VAVIAVEPRLSVDVVNCALPPASCAVPITVFPAENVTGPVGITVGDVIVAVNVTGLPWLDGFSDELRAAALVVSTITWFNTADVLLRLCASPLYTATKGYRSALRFDLVNVAVPWLFSAAEPIVWPQVNVTLPVGGIGPEDFTAAVKVTFCP